MPTVDAYRRAPLANPIFVPLPDGSVQMTGMHGKMTEEALSMADIGVMSPLDAMLASKLGGYADLPPVPDVPVSAARLREDPQSFILLARASLMAASATRNKESFSVLIDAMRTFLEVLPELSQEQVFPLGADALRLTSELYRRTGLPFLLTILESLRAQLPDVSGIMHSFPFIKPYEPQDTTGMDEATTLYHERMERLATGSLMADALAMSSFLALFSGSSRDGAASLAGLNALTRYHGVPTGAFTADPFLAGRDPARATDLAALSAQIEALADLIMASGNLAFIERLEQLVFSALPDFFAPSGIRALQPINRLPSDDSCTASRPDSAQLSALLRALYAVRRCVWVAKEEDEIALLMPMDGGCLFRVNGVPVRLTASVSGTFVRTVTIALETAQPVPFTLHLRVPAHASEASISVNGGSAQAIETGAMFGIQRTFRTGDTIVFKTESLPRVESGYRGSLSVLCGAQLMALPISTADVKWQFALLADSALTPAEEDGELRVLAAATDADGWQAKNGFITPPPQGIPAGGMYQLTLLPFSDATGRIAEFPCAAQFS